MGPLSAYSAARPGALWHTRAMQHVDGGGASPGPVSRTTLVLGLGLAAFGLVVLGLALLLLPGPGLIVLGFVALVLVGLAVWLVATVRAGH